MKKEYILLCSLLCVLLAAGIWIYSIVREYQKAGNEYESLKEYVTEESKTPDANPAAGQKNDKNDTQQISEEKEVEVDFQALQELNPDIVAWLRIPGVMDYPVVQGKDNAYYLKHTFKKEYNIAGSIFLDYRNQKDFSDPKSIIYGHNMKDGSMFHVLRKFQNLDFFREHQKLYLYLPEGGRLVFDIIACEEVSSDSEVYQLVTENTKMKEIMLSTCSSRSDKRLIIRGTEIP